MKRPWRWTWEVAVGGCLLVLGVVLDHFDAFERFVAMTRRYERYQLDQDMIWLVLAAVFFVMLFVRRSIAFKAEAVRRQASDARFAALFAASPNPTGLFSLDDGTLLDANATAVRVTGMRYEDLLGRRMRDLPFWEPATADELLRRMRADRLVRNMEMLTRRGSDPPRPVLVSAQAFELEGKQSFVAAMTDITEQRTAERLRSESDAALGKVFMAMRDVVLVMSRDGEYLRIPATNANSLYRPAAELLGKRVHEVLPAHEADTVCAVIRESLDADGAVTMEYSLHIDGRDVWFSAMVTPLDADSVVWVARDITDDRAAQESLRRQALVFETMSEGVVVCDADGRIIDVNPAAKLIFGYEPHELIGQTSDLWKRAEVSAATYLTISEALETRGAWSGEYSFVARDRHTGIVDVTIQVLFDGDGKPVSRVSVIRDVTERRELDRYRLQAQKLEAIGSLAAGIAHEINTPMQYVGDNVRFLGETVDAFVAIVRGARALADAARAHAGLGDAVAAFDGAMFSVDVDYLLAELPVAAAQSREGCDRIAEIVKAMNRFSHARGSQNKLVDLNAAVRDTVTVCRSEWKYVAVMTTALDEAMPLVPCLLGELQQVVLNLIVNAAHAVAEARHASGELGQITVSTRVDGDWAEIRVQDDGAGIPEAIRGRVFDPFFTTKKVGSGTGQGLALGHATIVRRHEGTLTFDSVEGLGTTFIIRLPLDGGSEMRRAV